MKAIILLVTLSALTTNSQGAVTATNEAAVLTTLDGKKFPHGKVARIEGNEAVIFYSSGISRVSVDQIPDDIRKSIGYPTRAEIEKQKQFEQEQIAKGLVKREAEKVYTDKGYVRHPAEWITKEENAKRDKAVADQMKDFLKSEVKSIREIESDQHTFLDKEVSLSGTMDLDNYYNWGYAKAQEKYYSFLIKDKTGIAHVYMERHLASGYREQLVEAGRPLRGLFRIKITSERFNKNSGEIIAELTSVSPPVD